MGLQTAPRRVCRHPAVCPHSARLAVRARSVRRRNHESPPGPTAVRWNHRAGHEATVGTSDSREGARSQRLVFVAGSEAAAGHTGPGSGGAIGRRTPSRGGLRQFAYLGHNRVPTSTAQFNGFRTALAAAGASSCALDVGLNSGRTPAGWNALIAELSSWIDTWKLPIGVYGTQDLVSRYLIDVCMRRGLRIPIDVAIVGTGNEPVVCDEAEPTLSSIDVGSTRVGYRAAELLDRLMHGEPAPDTPIYIEPTELVVRALTDVFAVDDAMVARAMQFIAQHGHEPIHVPEVVAALPITRRSLERRFRHSLGRSIAEEICRLRLERAKRLIVGTSSTISSISAAAGFSNDNHFNKVFRQSEGMTPGAFRRQHST